MALLALLVSFAGVAGSLYLSLQMGLVACPLCYYQRAFILGSAAVLLVGLMSEHGRPGMVCLLAAPLAAAGLGVALFHVYLVWNKTLECPAGLFGLGPAPLQSMVMFSVLLFLLLAGALLRKDASLPTGAFLATLVLGGLAAWGCIASAQPLPPERTTPYDADKE